MKIFLHLVIFFFLFSGLSSYGQYTAAQFPSADSAGKFLKGSWKWYKSCGGFSFSCITPTSPASYPKSLTFNKIQGVQDSITYIYSTSGTVTSTGGTKITNAVITNPTTTIWFLNTVSIYPGVASPEKLRLTRAKTDSMAFYPENCADCYEEFYVRDTTSKVTGINKKKLDNSLSQIIVYPNPANEFLKIKIDNDIEIKQCVIYNSIGQACNVSLNDDHSVNTANLAPGIYTLDLKTDMGNYHSKFIKD